VPSFSEVARDLGFDLSPAQLESFAAYRDRIAEAAGRFNLTTVRDPDGIDKRHFLESLSLARLLVDSGLLATVGGQKVLDLGSGAGFPGLPLKIALPLIHIDLLEANGKRSQFLRETCQALDLKDVRVLSGRAETLARDAEHRGAYDLVLARAVSPLPLLVEYSLPFLRLGGFLAAPKGSAATAEIAASAAALRELNGELKEVRPFVPPGGLHQTLVVIEKVGPTPERFPRKPGIARKRPLV
jgi:16S rRNA (guanine527-N7)-methyltransferase